MKKKYGDGIEIEGVIVSKRKFRYEEEVKANKNNHDAWFVYLRLVESESDLEVIHETCERAIADVPPSHSRPATSTFESVMLSLKSWRQRTCKELGRCTSIASSYFLPSTSPSQRFGSCMPSLRSGTRT
jgi:crooked neck